MTSISFRVNLFSSCSYAQSLPDRFLALILVSKLPLFFRWPSSHNFNSCHPLLKRFPWIGYQVQSMLTQPFAIFGHFIVCYIYISCLTICASGEKVRPKTIYHHHYFNYIYHSYHYQKHCHHRTQGYACAACNNHVELRDLRVVKLNYLIYLPPSSLCNNFKPCTFN